MEEKVRDTDKPPERRRRRIPAARARCLGPLSDLESHVAPDWWSRIFNSYYMKTDGDVVDDLAITRREVDLFTSVLDLREDEAVLDLCCGQGRHSLELARRGFTKVEGLDRSHYLIQRAKAQAAKEGIPVRFREGDARKLPHPPDQFDVVMILGNSFGYFETSKDDLLVLKEVARVLKPWGRVLLDLADGDFLRAHYVPRSWEWIDPKHFVCRERALSADRQRLISREVIVHTEKGVEVDQFYAERLYTPELIRSLLEEAGFQEVSFHGTLTPDSARGQDLGMMERRILVSARIRKEWTPVKPKKKNVSTQVAVVMGDPSKPDPLKPFMVFDDDDFYTIDRLKAALKECTGYSFTYLSRHETLIQDLMRLKGKIDYVFNLCDEGFFNDPRKELHVPALLEMLGIPYTGATPQGLAFCYDKSLVRGVAKEMGVPVPRAFFIDPTSIVFEVPFGFPMIVKPNLGDSSFGITQKSVVWSLDELSACISEIRDTFGYEKPVLVEEFLTGKDLTVGIIGNPPDDYMVLPIVEEDYSALPPELPRICGYEAKWLPDSPYWKALQSIPAGLPEATEKSIVEWCVRLFERLECRDYARFDWRCDADGNPYLLEVNPNPGWCWDGHLAKMARLAGMEYPQMLQAILKAAERRLGIR
ncbi:methyltransferase domain-containing protein [Spirochaeta thermophila]|uniref:D-alanine-D-alanine ligase related protein n=1 Tax=Winmispira thermophila (strain ATCC 49972 / DSM 6192 / RI 19.B1) TaxID=665571 RepID=E0RQQ5_WINT6|nr:methyltransferase domain-containing protein [Spirochaeta thermophila]ADN01559.1 D-alanine-D-alanine ligase related protein [Spirochaeta thermophila DSM 6192]